MYTLAIKKLILCILLSIENKNWKCYRKELFIRMNKNELVWFQKMANVWSDFDDEDDMGGASTICDDFDKSPTTTHPNTRFGCILVSPSSE